MRPEHLKTGLRIGGFVPFSSTDYPGQLAAVVFCQGCPWRCTYCHNPHLLPTDGPESHAWAGILAFLETRRGLLDAVVFSGGEPTLQRGLAEAMRTVKNLGFKVGLHSAGMYPERLERVLPLVDWIGLDIKAPCDAYPELTCVPGSGEAAYASLQLVLKSSLKCDLKHEIRCTWLPDHLPWSAVEAVAESLLTHHTQHFTLQAGAAVPAPAHTRLQQHFRHFTLRDASRVKTP